MITAFTKPINPTTAELHAVRTILQKGLTSIRALTFCKFDGDAGAGIHQVADWAFDGRPKYGDLVVCQQCAQVVTALAKVPPR